MDNHFEHCSARVTSLEQDGFLVKIHAQVPSDSGVSGRKLLSRVDQISGHLRRVKCCESISRGQLAFARIEDNFHRVRALGDNVEGRVAVKFIDYGHEDVLLLSDIVVVDPPLSDVLTTVRPLAEEFYLDGILLMRPLSNEEIVVLSEKILYKTVSCRLRRFHPELSLIELATTTASGDRQELFSNIVIELGFGNKCSSEDIAKYLRIKIPARADDPATMQSGRPFANHPYSIPPPTMLGSQPTTMLGSQPTTMLGSPTTMLGSQPTTMLGSQPTTMLGSQPSTQLVSQPGNQATHTSVNARLAKFKRDAALNMPGSGLYTGQASSPPSQLADRKQYTVTDGRSCTTAPTLQVKSTHNAYISHIEDGPFNFTIQLKSSVEDLLPKLRNILVRYQNAPITAQLIPGSVVMAKSSDETLRRGVIMNVQPETCKVYYIDFGNFEELPYSDIFQLPNTAAELSPAMAMQFCLSDLKSMKITDSNKDYFARLLLGKQVLIRVTERESNSPFQYCEILWEGRSVREILLNLNSPMQYSYQYPPRGREAPVSVIYVDGPSQFFVQYRAELNVVNQIQEALASYCPSQPRVTDLGAINIGSPVASIFPDDQRWYRALVMGMDSTNINVFYVDYGNRAEVKPNQICLLSRDLVNKWKTQAIECCLIGFDTVTPDLFMAEKMEDAALGHSYTLRLHSILSGFRLSVDLLDEQGNSIATSMKNLLNERQKAISHTPTLTEKVKAQTSHEDDRSSQHSRMATGVYEPPLAKAQKSTKTSDSGGKKNKFQRPGTKGDRGNKFDQRGERKFDDRNKFEERPNSYSQHDDRSGNEYKPRNDSRSDWKKGAKKPYMDQENEWDNSNQEPKSYAKKDNWNDKQDSGTGGFKKQEWKTDEKSGWGGDSSNRGSRPDRGDRQGGGFRSDGDRRGGSNRFERKPFNNDEDGRNGDRGDSWGSKDRKFGDRDSKVGDRDNKFGGRDNKFGDRENKFGDRENKFGDRENKFGDRENKFGDRENKFGDRETNRFGGRDNKFGDRDNKFGGRDKPSSRDNRKPHWNEDGAVQRSAVAPEDSWDDSQAQAPVKRPSVVISEYPHQEIKVGQEYKVLFAGMETSARDVYVQLSDCDPELDKIRSMIDADATTTSRPISNAVLAMPVLARFQDDGLLYRATIKSISKVPSGQVDVLFIDFGNTAVNALSEVFAMSSELMSIPIQAIHVIVTDMPTTPFANLAACQAHFDTDYLTLKPSRTTTFNLEQVIEGTLIRPDGQSVADCVKNDPSCHGEQLHLVATESPLASSAVLESQEAPEAETSLQPPLVLWRERLDLLLGQQLLAKVVKKYTGDNVYSIKITAVLDLIVPAQSVDPLSTELTQGDDVIVAVDGLAEDRLLVKYYNRQGQSLGEGDAIGAMVPMQIVQRKGAYTVSHREASTLYLQHEDSTTLSDLLERLFEKYEGSASGGQEFKVGDVTAAKSFDGNWYRAKISAIVEDMYTVNYLDYGNDEEMTAENLRKLDEEFSSPKMCVSVELPITYKDMEGCIGTLGDGPFECSFIKLDPNGVWNVDICSIGELNENFALKWIEAGKAESRSDISADPERREPWWNLKKGDRVPIIISHIELPDIFFAHRFEQSNNVQALQDEIQDLPEGGDLGEVFVAKYTQDSMWYRAVRFGDQVRFVDYGNVDPSVEMKTLPANLIHPAKGYAMPLRLCVRASGVEWTMDSAQVFDDFIDKSGLEAEIISVDFETIVDLRSGDESLSAIYIDGGHAVSFITPLKNNDLGGCVLEDELPVGKVPATVTAITSVNDFYVQENSKLVVLDLLASKLEAADSFEVLEQPSVGHYLVAKFVDDSSWYRAKVINQDPIEVLFIDYGNISPATEFRVLPLDLAVFPSLSWHCLVNVEDSPAINDLFTSLVDGNTVFDVSFVEKKDDLHVVQLSINNQSPFDELSTISKNENSEMSTSAVEHSADVQVKPIPPALTKPLYKDCVLCHSNGPYDFYVQTDDDHIRIDEMANALFEAGSFPKIDSVKKGDFVVAQFTEDDAYYRAIVTDIEPEVVVHFIDYGNSCPASCFHELPAPLKEIPQLAVRCSLQSPIGGWSVDAIDKFTSLLNPETKSMDLKIVSRGDPAIVDVEINGSSITKQLAPDAKFEPDSIQEAPSAVNDEGVSLLSSGLCYIASATPKECYIHDSSSSADLDVITEHLASIDLSDVNSELKDVEVGDLVGACHEDALYRACITKLDPPEVYFIDYGNTSPATRFFKLPDPIKNKKPLAMKVKLDLGEGVELNDDGLIELQNLAVDGADYTQIRPSVVELSIGGSKITDLLKSFLVIADSSGDASESKASTIAPAATTTVNEVEYVPITISHVNSPSDFYYQLDLPKVNEMSSRLVDTEGFLPVEKCGVGQVICGKYSEDELWYRAKILTTEPSVTVMFLDYGNIAEVEEMKQLPDDLAKIPPLCVKASLKPQEQNWTEEEVNKFMEIAYGSADFTCSVIESCADVVIVRLNSSEVGDVMTHLGRSCSLMTSSSEYGSPELSVDDMVLPVQYQESAVVDRSGLIDQQMSSVQDGEIPFQLADHVAEKSKVRSGDVVEPKIDVLPSETENLSPAKTISTNSKPSPLIHAEDDIEIPIIGCKELTVQAKSNQASPTKNLATPPESLALNYETDLAVGNDGITSKGDLGDDAMDRSVVNRDNLKDGEIIQTLDLQLPESEPRVQGNVEPLGNETCPTDVAILEVTPENEPCFTDVAISEVTPENEQGFTDVAILEVTPENEPCPTEAVEEVNPEPDVDVNYQLTSSTSRALVVMSAQASLMPILAESSAHFVNPVAPDDQTEVDPPFLASVSSTVELETHEDSESSLRDDSPSTADFSRTKLVMSEPLASDKPQNVPESSSFFRLPNLKETLLSVIGYESYVTSENLEQTASDLPSSSDTIIPSESETSDENNQSEIMNCGTVGHASTTFDRISESNDIGDQSVEIVLPSSSSVLGESVTEHFSSDVNGEQSVTPPSITEQTKPTVSLKPADGKPVASSMIEQESNSKANLPSDTDKTDVPIIAPMADDGKLVAEDVSNGKSSLHEEQRSPDDAYIEPREQITVPSGAVDSPVKPDFSGNTSNQDVSNDECIISPGMTFAKFLAHPRAEATLDDTLAELMDDIFDDEPLSEEPLPATTIKDEEKITAPSLVMEKSEDWKTESNVTGSIVVVDPVVSANITTHAETKGIEKSTVSKEQEIASVKPAPKTSSTITEPRKRTPVKTVAQIKASAKPRISTGRPASSNLKNKPPSKSGSPSTVGKPSSTTTSPQSTVTSPKSSSERDRIIPGTVSGRTPIEGDRIIPGIVSGRNSIERDRIIPGAVSGHIV